MTSWAVARREFASGSPFRQSSLIRDHDTARRARASCLGSDPSGMDPTDTAIVGTERRGIAADSVEYLFKASFKVAAAARCRTFVPADGSQDTVVAAGLMSRSDVIAGLGCLP